MKRYVLINFQAFLILFNFPIQSISANVWFNSDMNDSTKRNKQSFFINIASGIWTDNFKESKEKIESYSRYQGPNFRLNLEWGVKTDSVKRWRLGLTHSIYQFQRSFVRGDPFDIYSGSEDIKRSYLIGLNSLWELSMNSLHKNNLFLVFGIEYSYLYRQTDSGWIYYKPSFYSKYNVPSKTFVEPKDIPDVRWYHQYFFQLLFRFEWSFYQLFGKKIITGFETRVPFFFFNHEYSRTIILDKYFLDFFISIKL